MDFSLVIFLFACYNRIRNGVVSVKRSKIMWRVLKRMGADRFLYSYIIIFIAIATAITVIEPDVKSVFDGLWYCFSVATTIGFGDIVVTTVISKVLSVVLSVCSILIIALIPGLITSFYLEVAKLRANESMEKFMYDLERLPELSKEELSEISEKVKKFNKKNR